MSPQRRAEESEVEEVEAATEERQGEASEEEIADVEHSLQEQADADEWEVTRVEEEAE